MKIGIIGLGLIGGSMAKAYRAAGHEVHGFDLDHITLGWAKLSGLLSKDFDINDTYDLILIAVTPITAVNWMNENAPKIAKSTVVIDLCGTKRTVCEAGFALAAEHGYTYAGGHPMAGTHLSGIKNSSEELFREQTMVIVPPRHDDIALYDKIKRLLEPAGFGRYTFTTADIHDEIIAYTSQLAHVVSNAYVKSPRAIIHNGMSAGSYRDLTRVARLNEHMWAELFMENRDNLIDEIDIIIKSMTEYRDAMAEGDKEKLTELLRDGRIAKEKAD